MNKKLLKGIGALVPVAALALNLLADHLADKERDEKFVSKEELEQLLKDKKES